MALPQKNLPDDKPQRAASRGAFDPERLKQELLSLGHPRITLEIAQALAQEVAAILGASSRREVTAPWVSQVVEERLKNRGILGEGRTRGLLHKGEATSLPTLEKFLTTPTGKASGIAGIPDTTQVSPPRARLQITPRAQGKDESSWQQCFESLAQRAAAVEAQFSAPIHGETLAVEFFNSMANQEFYPHAPELLQMGEDWPAHGSGQVWMDLPLGPESTIVVLREAQRIWREGVVVGFTLRGSGSEQGFSDEAFEEFLLAVERSLLEMPEHLPLPPVVGLHLDWTSPQALAWAQLALSGKFYPKFSISFSLPAAETRLTISQGEALEDLLHQGPLLLRYASEEPTRSATFPRWGGGPELEYLEFCQLGSLNLSILACGSEVDWVKLRRIVRTAIHFLDNLIEAQSYPLEMIAQRSRANRKIGLGVMGLAELLIKLGIPYQSERAVILAEKTMRFIQHEAAEASHQLAQSRGVFPNYAKSVWKQHGRKVRHRTLTAVCPAPSLAELAGVTPGIGPLESIWQWDPKDGGEPLTILELLRKTATQKKVWSKTLEEDLRSHGSTLHCKHLPTDLQELFATRQEIPLQALARIQGALERPADGSVGINFSPAQESSSVPELLHEIVPLGLKQVQLAQNLRPRLVPSPHETGSAQDLPLEAATQETVETVEEAKDGEAATPALESFIPAVPRPTPDLLQARTRRVQTLHGEMKVTLGFDQHGPLELLACVGKAGSEAAAQAEALSRLISLLFSVGVEPQRIYQELKDIGCLTPRGDTVGTSLPNGVAQILSQEFSETLATSEDVTEISSEEEITELSEAGTLH
jgi:ribonucleotide reductase-like protein